jgi:hypothetical protein
MRAAIVDTGQLVASVLTLDSDFMVYRKHGKVLLAFIRPMSMLTVSSNEKEPAKWMP